MLFPGFTENCINIKKVKKMYYISSNKKENTICKRELIVRRIIKVQMIVLIIFINNIFAKDLDSLQNSIYENISQIIALTNDKDKLEKTKNDIDKDIIKIQETNKIGWLGKRKLANLYRQKEECNRKILTIYDQLLIKRKTTQKLFSEYYPFLKNEISRRIEKIEHTKNSISKENEIFKILDLTQKRQAILEMQIYFTDVDTRITNPDHHFLDFVSNSAGSIYNQELKKILSKKISSIRHILQAAREEVNLRERLDQFNMEISYYNSPDNISNDVSYGAQSKGATFTNESADETDLYNYQRWGASDGDETQDLIMDSPDNYLFLFRNIETTLLPDYISNLDSLCKYYQQTLNKIEGK